MDERATKIGWTKEKADYKWRLLNRKLPLYSLGPTLEIQQRGLIEKFDQENTPLPDILTKFPETHDLCIKYYVELLQELKQPPATQAGEDSATEEENSSGNDLVRGEVMEKTLKLNKSPQTLINRHG